jgi:hypothetical protein
MTIRLITVDDAASTAQDTKDSLLTQDDEGGSATKVTNSGELENTGDITVNTDKVTITASSGDINTAGDLTVDGDSTLTGNTEVTGDFTVNTDKMTVDAGTGDINIAGALDVAGNITIEKGLIVNTTEVDSDTYDLLTSDHVLLVSCTTTDEASITLPTAQAVAGRLVTIIDTGGNADTNNITVDTEGSEKINGESNLVINSDYDSSTLISDGTDWFIKS